MATITRRTGKNGQPSYRAQVRRKGASPLSATFTKVSEARKWIQITEAAILEGRHFKVVEAKRHTLAEMVDRYSREVLPHKRSSTTYGQRYQLQWWKKPLGHRLLADITPPVLVEYRDKLAQGEGKRRSPATINRYLALLSHCLTLAAQEWGWLENSPMGKVRKMKEPRGRVRFLNDEERERLLVACQESRNPYLYVVTVLALSTGARRGELLSLRWSDVDLKRGMLTFRETKNGETRAVPITGYALDILIQHAKVRRLDTPLVFPDSTGTRPFGIRDAFENAVQRADIANFHFHDLRHCAASALAMSGASLAEIAEVLGHKTLAMVKRYAHLSEAHTAGVVARMNAAIFGQ